MMKRFARLALSLLLLGFIPAFAQTLSDAQVLEYVKRAMQQGKGQQEIAVELLSQGVTEEQALRVKEMYQQQMGSTSTSTESSTQAITASRMRQIQGSSTQGVQSKSSQLGGSKLAPANGATSVLADTLNFPKYNPEDEVFGRSIFSSPSLTFEPNINLSTPQNYRLGPGDEVIIDIWGASENTIRQEISPDGYINIPNLGLVYLNNKSINEADALLQEELRKIYADEANQIKSAWEIYEPFKLT